jgi:hypothetical protein
MFLGCLGRFRCRARSLGKCVVVVWHLTHGRLASCREWCVLCVWVRVRACVCWGCVVSFFVLGYLFPFSSA